MEAADTNLEGVDIVSLRRGRQLFREQRVMLVSHVNVEEIDDALKGVGDLKAHGLDGYGANFLKKTWDIIGQDVFAAIMKFFKKEEVGQVNGNLVTLIAKSSNAKTIREYRPISCCTITYKIYLRFWKLK